MSLALASWHYGLEEAVEISSAVALIALKTETAVSQSP
jgi:hypothetical protein